MVKRNLRKKVAVIIAAVMIFQQGGAVRAAEDGVATEDPAEGEYEEVLIEDDTESSSLSGEEGEEVIGEDITDPDKESALTSADAQKKEVELPAGINPMPEDYRLSDEQIRMKKEALSHGVLTTLESLTEGVDYVESQVIALADSSEEAEAIANTYSGVLLDYSYGVATISLLESSLSVYDAFTYSLDEDLELPMVEPDYVRVVDEPQEEGSSRLFAKSYSAGEEVPADNGFSDRWWIDNMQDPYLNPLNSYYQWHHDLINSYSAWGVTTGSHNIRVAVLDSGVNASHEDLDDNIDTEHIIEVVKGIGYEDTLGHGTHVAGIIAAELNNLMGAGVAPGVYIVPAKVVKDSGSVPDSYVIKGIAAAAGLTVKDGGFIINPEERIADIINMSFGDGHYNQQFADVIAKAYEAGVTIISAVGNDNGSNHMNYPACYDHVIGVCSVDQSGSLSNFCNSGYYADIASPGNDIYSTYRRSEVDYYVMSGTSMATPVISGACALYMSAVGHVDPDTMERVLKASVTGNSGYGTDAGIIDLAKLFDGDTTAPEIKLNANDDENTLIAVARSGNSLTASCDVATDTKISFTAMNFGGNEEGNANTKIVYTTNGKAPSVFNGDVLNGTAVSAKEVIAASDITGEVFSRTKVTIKAAAVTGMGVMGEVTTLVFYVNPSVETLSEKVTDNLEVRITNAPEKIVAGKSFKLEAKVTSDDETRTVSQKVTWKIESYSGTDLSTAKIGASNGNLTTPAGKTGELVISCMTADSRAETSVTIQVTETYPVKTLALGSDASSMGFNYGVTPAKGDVADLYVTDMTDTQGHDLLTDEIYTYKDKTLLWTSSNEKAVRLLDEDITHEGKPGKKIVAVGNGTSIITCKVLDGSGKSAKISMKVYADVTKLTSSIKLYEGAAVTEESTPISAKTTYAGAASFDITSKSLAKDGTINCMIPLWQNSNSKVVRLEVNAESGNTVTITPLSKGTSSITCSAADGSGKKAVLKITVTQRVKAVSVSGQNYVAAGTSAKFTAALLPSTANNKKVSWSFADPENPEDITKTVTYEDITINASNGTVKVAGTATAGQEIIVRAIAVDGSESYGCHSFKVWERASKVTAAVVSDYSNVIATKEKGNYHSTTKIRAAALDKNGMDIGTKVSFKSSNEKVARVSSADNEATVTAVGKGTATIKAMAQDGSGKSASIKIAVKQLADSITVTGLGSIVQGSRTTYKATVLPSNAGSKKVTWYLVNPATGAQISPEGVRINSGTGQVIVDKQAPVDLTDIGVMAVANDNGAAFADNPVKSNIVTFRVAQGKATRINIYADVDSVINSVHDIPQAYDGSEVISSFRLYDTDIPDLDVPQAENQIRLKRSASRTSGKDIIDLTAQTGVIWSSNNTKVAVVEQDESGNAVVTGVKAGTATITCTANDGSGKKSTAKVTVIKPASGISIGLGSGLYKQTNVPFYMGYGGNHTVKGALGTEYGQPTVSAFEWDYEIGIYSGGSFKKIDDLYKAYYKDINLFFKFSNGLITANSVDECDDAIKKFKNEYPDYTIPSGERAIRVIAKTTDGTGYETDKIFRLTDATDKIKVYTENADGEFVEASGCTLSLDDEEDINAYIDILTESGAASKVKYCSITSDSPEVATGIVTYESRTINGKRASRSYLDIYIHQKGIAVFTIKALDGTGKTATFTVNVN